MRHHHLVGAAIGRGFTAGARAKQQCRHEEGAELAHGAIPQGGNPSVPPAVAGVETRDSNVPRLIGIQNLFPDPVIPCVQC